MDELTGKLIEGEAYIRQSVRRAISTFKLSMLMHRELGPNLLPYIAEQTSDVWMLSLAGEIVDSIEALLAEVEVSNVTATSDDGSLIASVTINWQESVFLVSSAA